MVHSGLRIVKVGRTSCNDLRRRALVHAGFGEAYSRVTNISLRRANYATLAEDEKSGPRTNPFPYPGHANPTPYQIFHLPYEATKTQIKSRYYELVRAHHPDSTFTAHLPPQKAHDNFRNIKASYDYLTGKTTSPNPNERAGHTGGPSDPYVQELARRRRAYYASRSRAEQAEASRAAHAKSSGGLGANPAERTVYDQDGWRERTMLVLGVITLIAGLFPTMPATLATAFLPASAVDPKWVAEKKVDPGPPGTAPPFNIPFVDLDRGHREAVSSLIQVREDFKEIAAERRDKIKQRVAEMPNSIPNRNVSPPATREAPASTDPIIAIDAAPGVLMKEPTAVPNAATRTSRKRSSPHEEGLPPSTPQRSETDTPSPP